MNVISKSLKRKLKRINKILDNPIVRRALIENAEYISPEITQEQINDWIKNIKNETRQ